MKSEQKRRAIQIVGALKTRGTTVAVDPIIALLQELIDAPAVRPDTRMRVKLGSQYGSELNGHWFYLQPADEYAEAALAKHTGIPAPEVQSDMVSADDLAKLLAALIDLVNQPQDITTPAYQNALVVISEAKGDK